MSSRARGRSPARKGTTPTTIKSATTPKRSATAEKSRRTYAGTSAETLDGKSIDQKEMAGLGDTEARLTRKLKNTPEHLYGKNHRTVNNFTEEMQLITVPWLDSFLVDWLFGWF